MTPYAGKIEEKGELFQTGSAEYLGSSSSFLYYWNYQKGKTVLFSFDNSRVALIISPKHEEIAEAIGSQMHRGVTLLEGEGYYTHQHTKVIMTAIRSRQLTDLKRTVSEVDPDAFVIIQESHQVLGKGFGHYSKTGL